jgi:hypothetical protein
MTVCLRRNAIDCGDMTLIRDDGRCADGRTGTTYLPPRHQLPLDLHDALFDAVQDEDGVVKLAHHGGEARAIPVQCSERQPRQDRGARQRGP